MTLRRRRRPRDRGQSGVTLIELMISLVIASIGVAASFAVGMTIMGGYRDHRRMSSVERAARSSMEILASAIRGASAGVPTGDVADVVGCGEPGSVQVTNGGEGPDEIVVIHASGGVITSLRAPFLDTSSKLVVTDGSELAAGDYVIVTDMERGHLIELDDVIDAETNWVASTEAPGAKCGKVDFPSGGYPAGSYVIRAGISRFSIERSELVGGVPTLMLDPDGPGPADPEPLAPGIEDLQIAIGVDVDEDGEVADDADDDDEWFYNHPDDDVPPELTSVQPRAYRATVVARSLTEAGRIAKFFRPAIEDRPQAEDVDVFRRRILSATIEVRNLAGSP